MGFFDALFGRQKPIPVGPERLFAMSTAQVTLEVEQQLTPTGSAAICFKGIASGAFVSIQSDLEQLLRLTSKDDQLTLKPYKDSLGYSWFIFTGADFQALVAALHTASQTLIDKGYDSQLLFALFAFKMAQGNEMYWMYNYKRGFFYPFVPKKDTHDPLRQRDNPQELRLASAVGKELPVEQEYERWYPVWDLPL
ncbi:MAG TPA: hypothetical protein VKQ36_12720 [Ktedonobacterales bacterium]|nr:hypothetical protein [Ktedonobacterales bacterium]